MKQLSPVDFTAVADLTALAFENRRPGCARNLLHEDDGMRASVLRVQPASGVPGHKHSATHDLFVGIKGDLEIHWDGGCFLLRPGGFCRVPPDVRHEIRNPSERQQAYCIVVHTGPGPFDFIEMN